MNTRFSFGATYWKFGIGVLEGVAKSLDVVAVVGVMALFGSMLSGCVFAKNEASKRTWFDRAFSNLTKIVPD
jgi:hypothetical protein